MQTNEAEGPAWNKFWLSMDNESDSMVSGGLSSHQRPHTPIRSLLSPDLSRSHVDRQDSVLPNDSASHHGEDVHSEILEPRLPANDDSPFPFKFKAPSGRVHRLNVVPSAGIAEVVVNITAKLGSEVNAVGGEAVVEDGKLGNTGFALSYLDNEGDTVSITTDQDLVDAISLARRSNRDKVDLFVHDPEKPPVVAPEPPLPVVASKASTPPESVLRSEEDVPHGSEASYQRKTLAQSLVQPSSEQQLINGVPNELLLPGAIVTLAAVIAGVFVLSRVGGNR
jgi:hypothetical protein